MTRNSFFDIDAESGVIYVIGDILNDQTKETQYSVSYINILHIWLQCEESIHWLNHTHLLFDTSVCFILENKVSFIL